MCTTRAWRRACTGAAAGRVLARLFVAMLCVCLPAPRGALASDQVVTNTNDSGAGSLRQAIADAQNGDTITFNLGAAPATLLLTSGALAIDKSLTIVGPGAALLTIDGNNAGRVFVIQSGNVAISGMTLARGYASGDPATGGAIWNGASLTLSGVTVRESRAEGAGGGGGEDAQGGGIYNAGGCTLENSQILSNTAQAGSYTPVYGGNGEGGGLYNQGVLTVTHTVFLDNRATGGPAADRYGGSGMGGGLANAVTGTVAIYDSAFAHNRSEGGRGVVRYGGAGYGGGIYNTGAATLISATVTSNTAVGGVAYDYGGWGSGGGIYNQGVLSATQLSVAENAAGGFAATHQYCGSAEGGGIATRGALTLTQSLITGNHATGATGPVAGDATAGGIFALGALRIENSAICDNVAEGGVGTEWTYGKPGGDGNAGGIFSHATGDTAHVILGATICNNLAAGGAGDIGGDADAGGLWVYKTLTVADSAIRGNRALAGESPGNGRGGRANGGGTYTIGDLTLTDTTVAENLATGGAGAGGFSGGGDAYGGGIYQGYGGALAVERTTIYSNTVVGGDSSAFRGGNAYGGGFTDSTATYTPTVRLVNSTVVANRALRGVGATADGTAQGGGLHVGVSAASISFVTIAGNASAGEGGGIFSAFQEDDQGPALRSVIVAGNSAAAGPDLFGRVQSRGHNLIQNATGATLDTEGNGNTATGNLLGADPLLGPLQDNGGPTWTCALSDGEPASPAIDAGSTVSVEGEPITVDQRGLPRPSPGNGASDMGAFEVQVPVWQIYLPMMQT